MSHLSNDARRQRAREFYLERTPLDQDTSTRSVVDLLLAFADAETGRHEHHGLLGDRDAELRQELRAYLDTLGVITGDNIGDIRRSLFMPWGSQWNGWVRDETASRELDGTREGAHDR